MEHQSTFTSFSWLILSPSVPFWRTHCKILESKGVYFGYSDCHMPRKLSQLELQNKIIHNTAIPFLREKKLFGKITKKGILFPILFILFSQIHGRNAHHCIKKNVIQTTRPSQVRRLQMHQEQKNTTTPKQIKTTSSNSNDQGSKQCIEES